MSGIQDGPFEPYRPSPMEVWGLADRGRRTLTELDGLDSLVSEQHRRAVEAVTDELERPVYRSGVPVSRDALRFRESVSFAQGALGLWAEAIWQFNDGSVHPRSIAKLNAAYAEVPSGEVPPDLYLEHRALWVNLDEAADNIAAMIQHGPSKEYVQLMLAHGALPLWSPLLSRYLDRELTSTDRIARAASTIRMFSAGGWETLAEWSERPLRVLSEELADLTPEEMDALFSASVLTDEDLVALSEQLVAATDVDLLTDLASTIWSRVDEDTVTRLNDTMPALEPGIFGWTAPSADSEHDYDESLSLVPAEPPHLDEASENGLNGDWSTRVDDGSLTKSYRNVGLALQNLLAENPDWPQEHITPNANGTYTIHLDREFWTEWRREAVVHLRDEEIWPPAQSAVEVTVSGYVPAVSADGPSPLEDWARIVLKAAAPYAMSRH